VISEPVDLSVEPRETTNQPSRSIQNKRKSEAVGGYVEWLRDGMLIADGQRIRWDSETRVTLGRVSTIASIPLGYEVKVKGVRLSDRTLLAQKLDVKPNGLAAYESEVRHAQDALEAAWTSQGVAFLVDEQGNRADLGRIVESGPDVERARRILNRLIPPYVSAHRLRVRVIQSNVWNAAAMQNGAIWVFKGLLDDVSDDELAAVLGHELAHYTHEHSRRGARNGVLVQLAALGAQAAVAQVQSDGSSTALSLASDLSLSAWRNRYSRVLEDQADRVGLRYAHEAGYDVTAAVRLWRRVREQEGERDAVSNFLWGDHSRPTNRIKNIELELRLNYITTATQ
jgi:Zn-dependent protease with chaperone function